MKLSDFGWIVALGTWVPELVSRGTVSETAGWGMALFFVVALAGARVSSSSMIGKALHLGVPIAALIVFIVMHSLTMDQFMRVLTAVMPMLVAMSFVYVLIVGIGGNSKEN